MKHKFGFTMLVIGGVFMIISSTVGSIGVYEFLFEFIKPQVDPSFHPLLDTIFKVIKFIADLGGYAIILGAILIMFNQYRLGKWIIGIGLAFGLIALIIWVVTQVSNWLGITITGLDQLYDLFSYNTGFAFIGVVIIIIGRYSIKKPKKKKEEEVGEEEEVVEAEASEVIQQVDESAPPPKPSETKFCPNCGAPLPLNVNYCTECGATFDR